MEREVYSASDASRLREGYLGALGYSVFAFVDGFESRPGRLRVAGPAAWPVFSTLAPRWPFAAGMVEASAADFYDSRTARSSWARAPSCGGCSTRRCRCTSRPMSKAPVDLDRLGRLAATAFERVAAYFGTVPFRHYTVHQELLQPLSPRHEYGMSMEHLGSSTYYLLASAGITAGSTPQDDARVLYNFAHHMAHAWVPKRASGAGTSRFSGSWRRCSTRSGSPKASGSTRRSWPSPTARPIPPAYRADMLARRFRSNLISAPPFLRRLTLVELSRVASTRYSEDFRTGRLVFSRGGLMAAALDERIQERTAKPQPARRLSFSRGMGRPRATGLRDRRVGGPDRDRPPASTPATSSTRGCGPWKHRLNRLGTPFKFCRPFRAFLIRSASPHEDSRTAAIR